MIKNIDYNEFEKSIKDIEGVCLVDFYATWCGPCMMLAPILEEISESRAGYNIYKVDVDKNMKLAEELNVNTIPTMCIYKNGTLEEKHVGFKNKDEIIELIEKYSQE